MPAERKRVNNKNTATDSERETANVLLQDTKCYFFQNKQDRWAVKQHLVGMSLIFRR